jgi:tyrosinase
MNTVLLALIASLALIQAAPSPFPKAKATYDLYRTQATAAQKAILDQRTSGCTSDNVIVRREW